MSAGQTSCAAGRALDAREPQVFDGSDVGEQPRRLAIGRRVPLQRLGDDRVGPRHMAESERRSSFMAAISLPTATLRATIRRRRCLVVPPRMSHNRAPLALVVRSLGRMSDRVTAQRIDPSTYSEMRWRMIGPFRASRTKAAAGIPNQPNVFYIGVVNGGVWKTTDYGRTWNPIFDDQPTGSIGAIAVAPSNPNVVYVGSGEGLQRPDLSVGDGIYKSTDAGETWTHLGLRDGQQIPQIVVDPRDPDRLYVAVLGHPYGPNAERGLFKSIDGGQTFQKILYKDENTGAVDVVLDPVEPGHRLRAFCGRRARGRGRTACSPVPAAACSNRPTRAPRGSDLAPACRRSSRMDSAASASRWRRVCRAGCSRRSKRAAAPDCIGRTTRARVGTWRRPTIAWRPAPRTPPR